MLDAALHACRREPNILCFVLRCNDDERRRRWIDLESRQVKLGSEVETLDKTKTIGNDTEATARSILLQQQVRTIWSKQEQAVTEVVDEIQCAMLDMVIPGPSPIFPSLQAAMDVVRLASQVLPELHQTLPRGCTDLEKVLGDGELQYPGVVVVVEGLDGTGKTSLVRRLVHHLGSNTVRMRSPPEALTNARTFVEKQCEDVSESDNQRIRNSKAFQRLKRAFFTFGNYVLAEEIVHSKTNSSSPVIIDRFASSTLAYTWGIRRVNYWVSLFRRILDFVLPFHKNQGPMWPDDLPKPNVVLILDADEHVRRQRIKKRSMGGNFGIGEWEKALERNLRLGPSISYHLRNIKNAPPSEIVDANANDTDEVFRRAASKLLCHGIAVVFRQIVHPAACEAILDDLNKAGEGSFPQGTLNRYKWDKTNKVYPSRRQVNVEVCFLQTEELKAKIAVICKAIAKATGRTGWRVQDDILPVFRYWNDGEILPHRDVNLTSLCDYCAILMVSKPGVDFRSGGFFVNASATVHDGGQMKTEVETRRQHFEDLQQGDIVVFRNSLCVHGVHRVEVGPRTGDADASSHGQAVAVENYPEPRGRITTSFRM